MKGGLAEINNTKEEDVDPAQLEIGIQVEMEHTDSPEIAKEIALDHLTEDPIYYTKLGKCFPEEKHGEKKGDKDEEKSGSTKDGEDVRKDDEKNKSDTDRGKQNPERKEPVEEGLFGTGWAERVKGAYLPPKAKV